MKWYSKLIISIGILSLIAAIGGMIYVVNAKNLMNEYTVQSTAVFNAAMLINADETFTDEEHAVIASFEDTQAVVIPENYKSVLYYLRENAAAPLFASRSRGSTLTISLCGGPVFTVSFDSDGEKATVELDTGEKVFRMRIRGINLREHLLNCALKGTAAGQNLPLWPSSESSTKSP